MPLCKPAGVGLLVDRHQPYQLQELTNTLLRHRMTLVAQVSCHLAAAEERRVEELQVDLAHQREVLLYLALRRIVEQRPRDL